MDEAKERDVAMGPETAEGSSRKLPRWLALEELERDRTRVSHNRDRVKTITQKLSRLQQGLEVDKNKSRTAFEMRLKELEGKIASVSGEQDQRLEEADQQIEHLMEALGQERLARELLDERKTKEAELLTKTVSLQLEELKSVFNIAQAEQAAVIAKLKQDLQDERQQRSEVEAKFGVKLGEQVSKLTDEMESVKKQNSELMDRVEQLHAQGKEQERELEKHRAARNDLEEHVVDMLEDLVSKLRTEIVAERNDREAMEETLLKLIEETCSRVEGGLVSSS
mmetsp:Transcript_3570/g.10413  ORF Transcript_3570/g.10413 Transcript_3570/m.10413 type:complete len:281 (+) Transcript_3570:190-1032(+)